MVSFSPKAKVRAVFGLLVLLNAAMAFSQVVTGTISGRVTDTTGAVVPGAAVQIQNVDTGLSRTAHTDSEGRYSARNLPLGSYSVTVQQAGFQTQVRRGIALTVGSEAVVNLELAVGAVQETVEVTAAAPAIETTTATLSGLVSSQQIRDLPLNGRSIDQLALLSPGVFANRNVGASPSTGMGIRISVNGGRPSDNLYLLDGTVVNDHGGRGLGSATTARLGVEGILEFRVLTHNFSAEYGRNAGGVISAVTRSGTNDFHGSVYEFVRNNIFDARNFFNPGELPAFRRNQFGAAAGGRIIKDRLFFFVNYEGMRERRGTTVIASVPDAAARNGTVAGRPVTINPAAAPYVKLYPLPNGRNFGDGTGEYIEDFTNKATENYAMERMDFRLSDKDSVYWRYVFNPSEVVGPQPVPNFATTNFATNHYVILSETHIFSGASLNEFRFALNRTDPGQNSGSVAPVDPSLSFVPGQAFGTIRYSTTGSLLQLSELGSSRTAPQHFAQNIFQTTDTFSTVKGAHSLKFGADFQRIQINLFQGSFSRGAYQFGGLTDLLAGNPNRFSFLSLDPPSAQSRGWRRILFGWFVQDDFRVRPNLTLNLGFRHEFMTGPTDVNGRSGNLRHPTDTANVQGPAFVPAKLNLSPRIGLAWDPTGSGKTSVRAAGGVLYNQVTGRLWYHQADQNADYLKSYELVNPPFPNAGAAGIPPGALQINWTNNWHLDTPTVVHYNVEIQRELAPTVSLRAGYVGAYGYHMTRVTEDNLRIAQVQADGRQFFASNAPFLNPAFGEVGRTVSDATFNYNAMQLSLQKTLSAGLQLQASYTLSKTLSDADETGSLPAFSIPGDVQDKTNLGADYSLSSYDQRHTLVVNGVYQMPWDKSLNGGLAKAILGGWAINGVYSFNTGAPISLLAGFNNSRDGDRFASDRPDLNPGFSNNSVNGVTAGCQGIAAGQKLRTPDRWYDPCAFGLPAAGFYGNLGRNTVTGPGLSSFDFTILKTTSLTEQKKLEFRAEFFNLLNHANFFFPIINVFNSSRDYSGNAGRITSTSTDNREIQLGLKLIF
jgi:carboxypeptidase family protein/TonB-dependent receptor-like protein